MEEGLIGLCKIDTGLNVADMLTKQVGVRVIRVFNGLIGLVESG